MDILKPGDEIRVIAPSQSWAPKYTADYRRAQALWEKAGFRVTFGKSIQKIALQGSATSEDRAADFCEAYADKQVKAIVVLRGGWSANDILPFVDWEVVRQNPKPLIGHSDVTVLLNAVLAQAHAPVYLGPCLSPFSDKRFGQDMLDRLLAVLTGKPTLLMPSKEWGEPKKQARLKAKPWKVLQPGQAAGLLLGGNLGTFFLGQGTPYMPAFKQDFILAVEDDDEAGVYTAREFSRRLESILQQPNARRYLKSLLVGRFLPGSKVNEKELAAVIASKRLEDIPIVTNLDFGHSLPIATLPLGVPATVKTTGNKVEIVLAA